MLISYLGIDLLSEGDRAYRLLGCGSMYHDDLPAVGDTLLLRHPCGRSCQSRTHPNILLSL